jgi:DNA polymerase sigma
MSHRELTKHQIDQQDMIDNCIYHFIQSINPSDKEISWDIEMIGDVRDVLKEWFVDRLNLTTEQEFYPSLRE